MDSITETNKSILEGNRARLQASLKFAQAELNDREKRHGEEIVKCRAIDAELNVFCQKRIELYQNLHKHNYQQRLNSMDESIRKALGQKKTCFALIDTLKGQGKQIDSEVQMFEHALEILPSMIVAANEGLRDQYIIRKIFNPGRNAQLAWFEQNLTNIYRTQQSLIRNVVQDLMRIFISFEFELFYSVCNFYQLNFDCLMESFPGRRPSVETTNVVQLRINDEIRKRKHFDNSQHPERKKQRLKEYHRKRRLIEDTECPVCLEVTMSSCVLYPCLHHVCEDCSKSFRSKEAACPTCRAPIEDRLCVEGKPFTVPFKIGEETCQWIVNWNPGDEVPKPNAGRDVFGSACTIFHGASGSALAASSSAFFNHEQSTSSSSKLRP